MSHVNPRADRSTVFGMHQSRNEATRGASAHYGPHRNRVMQLLGQAAVSEPLLGGQISSFYESEPALAGGLAVLGAGNCNDLDLPTLQALFSHVTLIDLDAAACQLAVSRQLGCPPHNRICVAPSTDVSGLVAALENIAKMTAEDRDRASLCDHLKQVLAQQAGANAPGNLYHCVLSTCLLSPLIDSAVLVLGAETPQLPELIQAIRHQHLLYLINSLTPGGRGILVFDFLSNQTLPDLMQIPEMELPKSLEQAIASRNFFSGLNPFVIHQLLQSESAFRSRIDDVRLTPPWRWSLGSKQFAVAAVTFKRLD